MAPILSLLLILAISLVTTRVAALVLERTGLSREISRFQARSAFTGVGFTTDEAESIVGHPVRRRVAMTLMLLGPIGTASVAAAILMSVFDVQTQGGLAAILGVLVGGVAILVFVSRSALVDRGIAGLVAWAMRRFGGDDLSDYVNLLHVADDYAVARIRVEPRHWFADRSIGDAALAAEGILVLGLECPGGNWVGAPPPAVEVRSGDTVVLYGRSSAIAALEERRSDAAGDAARAQAVDERTERLRSARVLAGR